MTSPEQQPITNDESENEDAAIDDRIAAGQMIERIKEQAPTEQKRQAIELLTRVGDMAFAAYLTLPDIDPYSETLVKDFMNDIVNSYSSETEMATEFFNLLGFKRAIEKTVTDNSIPEGVVQIDTAVMADFIETMYDVVELDGKFYVFSQ